MLRLYNSLSNNKVDFLPINQNKIGMYVCGPTVYNEIHVGNARSLVVFDLLYRILRREYRDVTYVRNITDIDDKIIDRAKKENRSSNDVTFEFSNLFFERCKQLGLLEPTCQPRATETVSDMIEAISRLIDYDFAYVRDNHVYYKTSELDDYGALSKQNSVIAGQRVAIAESKNDQQDFVLWKPGKPNEPFWNSPWGAGRPGWHIECSVMSSQLLGERFDIHGGGHDLLFPHHENERAQNIGLFGKDAGPKYWVHNGMITFDGQKMSKSIGNIVLLRDVLSTWSAPVIKLFIMSSHYRHQLIWKDEGLRQSKKRLERWVAQLQNFDDCDQLELEMYDALLDDMNTPAAFAIFDEKLSAATRNNDSKTLRQLRATLRYLGLWQEARTDISGDNRIKTLLDQRKTARENRDFVESDRLRAEIQRLGYDVIDKGNDQILKKK
jgi:cysteinyl-tRNA synthetase